jgi:hypothetical protein
VLGVSRAMWSCAAASFWLSGSDKGVPARGPDLLEGPGTALSRLQALQPRWGSAISASSVCGSEAVAGLLAPGEGAGVAAQMRQAGPHRRGEV